MKVIYEYTRKAMIMMFAFLAIFSSCTDEDEIRDKNDDDFETDDVPVQIADSLVSAFAAQVDAMQLLMGESEAAVSYAVVRTGGDCLVAFADETSFVSGLAQDDYFSLLACHVENDSAFWMLKDKSGNAEILKDDSGEMIPIAADISLELDENGSYVLLVSGKKYDTVFTSEDKIQAFPCDFHMDADSNIYAVTFVMGADREIIYPSLNYNRVGFHPVYDLDGEYVTEFYVNNSSTSSLVLDIPDGISYTLRISEGWKAESNKVESVVYVTLTAPEEVENGTPSILEVVADNCGVALCKLDLVNEPFRSIFTSSVDVYVEPSVGVEKFVYGIAEVEDYSDDKVLSLSEGVISGNSEPVEGCGISEEAIKISFQELLGAELDPDKRYVLWAIPALRQGGNDDAYYVDEETLRSFEFGAMFFDLELQGAAILDAEISAVARGVEAVYAGVVPKSEGALELVASQIRNSKFTPISAIDGSFAFDGLLTDYPVAGNEKNEILPSTSYYVWIAPAFGSDYPYEEKDLTFMEVTTGPVVEGGAIEVVLGELQSDRSALSVPISAQDASMIYYAVLPNGTGKLYSGEGVENVDKFAQIMSNSPVLVRGSSVEAVVNKLSPNTTYWIFAVAVDADGKYGPVKCVSGKTKTLVFDESVKLSVNTEEITAQKIVLKVTSNGGDLSDYIYWTGSKRDPFWANSSYCGQSKTKAEQYMSLYPEDENIVRAMNKYGSLSSDGVITIDGLTMETEYVFVILEKGENAYSHVGYIMVKTLAADLGNVVKEGTDAWNTGKASVQIEWLKNSFQQAASTNLMSTYAFNFKCPDNLTAYVMCASEDYFALAGITKMEHMMIEIENYASRRYANGRTPIVNGELAEEPDYYKNGELHGGHLMNVYDFYVHGVPSLGFVTYFAKGSHGDGNCIYWDGNQCAQYQTYKGSIENQLTLTPYQDKAKLFGLSGDEAAAWAQALLEAYTPYYENAKPIVYENDGKGVVVSTPYATGVNEDGIIPDRVIVMLKDLDGNYYEPMYFEVPNYFQ